MKKKIVRLYSDKRNQRMTKKVIYVKYITLLVYFLINDTHFKNDTVHIYHL